MGQECHRGTPGALLTPSWEMTPFSSCSLVSPTQSREEEGAACPGWLGMGLGRTEDWGRVGPGISQRAGMGTVAWAPGAEG